MKLLQIFCEAFFGITLRILVTNANLNLRENLLFQLRVRNVGKKDSLKRKNDAS